MNVFKTTAAAVISSLVIGTAPAWSGTVDSRSVLATAQVISPVRVGHRAGNLIE